MRLGTVETRLWKRAELGTEGAKAPVRLNLGQKNSETIIGKKKVKRHLYNPIRTFEHRGRLFSGHITNFMKSDSGSGVKVSVIFFGH